eukprot:COSAG06_NODE_2774_length_6303_cov_15.722115_5_plen_42_part_00
MRVLWCGVCVCAAGLRCAAAVRQPSGALPSRRALRYYIITS